MTPDQFYNLDEQEQAELVWEGEFKGTREDDEHYISLYKVDQDLYIEVYFHKMHNVIRKFEALTEGELLDMYVSKN